MIRSVAIAVLLMLLLPGCGSTRKVHTVAPIDPPAPTVPSAPPPGMATAPAPTASDPMPTPDPEPAPPPPAPADDDVDAIRIQLLDATGMYRTIHSAWPTSAAQTLAGVPNTSLTAEHLAVFERIVYQIQADDSLALIVTYRRDGRQVNERYIIRDRPVE
jgi:hypothetical protein